MDLSRFVPILVFPAVLLLACAPSSDPPAPASEYLNSQIRYYTVNRPEFYDPDVTSRERCSC